MPRSPIEDYRLSPAAQADLNGIWDYTAEMWSPDQADTYLRGLGDTFDALCGNPEIARERTEIDPPVRLHPYRSHLILYRIEQDHLAIIRVVHSRQHWQAILGA
jgi:toxin ParE1/3/4